MSDFYNELRQAIICGNEEEGVSILKSLITPSDVKAQQNGALFNIVVRGVSIFNFSSIVKDAGISEDDPRAKKYNTVHGYLIDKEYVNRLQNISSKKDRIAVAAGGIPVMTRTKYLYWVPNNGIAKFKTEMDALADEYRSVVQEISDNYHWLRVKAKQITEDSAKTAWDSLSKDPAFTYDRDQYVKDALDRFDKNFVKQNDLFDKICIEVFRSDKQYHPKLAEILEKTTSTNANEEDIITNFFDLLESKTDKSEEVRKLKESFCADSGLSVSTRVSVDIMKNVAEIADCLSLLNDSSQKVSKRKLKNLYDRLAMHRGNNASVDKVIRMTNAMLNGYVTADGMNELNRLVLTALREVETEVDLEGAASEIARQAKNGEAGEALEQLRELEAGLESRLLLAQSMKSKIMGYYNAEITD
ncbi:MAG: hypothetical protein IJI14_20740 [Anaerolineaceae bacterium]|nr:hypothetical protein [Anaerolineaceae bacterium]